MSRIITLAEAAELRHIEETSALEAGTLGFSARLLAQLSLPYREPEEGLAKWERTNGNHTLTIRPSTIRDPKTGELRDGYPYGVLPRYILTYLATQAVRTQDPKIDLGPSMSSFMRQLGLSNSGRDTRRLKDQLQRLLGTVMQVTSREFDEEGNGEIVRGANLSVAAQYELWLPEKDRAPEGQFELWPSYILLTDPFFLSVIEAPVPVDLRALSYLAGSPLRIDIYIWLTYRMSYLRRPVLISWELLAEQFGADFKRLRAFKNNFIKQLQRVMEVYPAVKATPLERGLLLSPSPTHVPKIQGKTS